MVPRLKAEGRIASRYTALSDAALVVAWTFTDGSTLELRLNLSENTVAGAAMPQGGLIHCEPSTAAREFGAGELPPDSAAVYLTAPH